jgi:D-alanyl-D-alanine carboxypeptidase (penicillin-binding protein 5/6)
VLFSYQPGRIPFFKAMFLKCLALCGLALVACFQTALAQVPQAPQIAARSFLLVDITANQVLAGQEIDTPVEPASLTKLMTAYLVFDAIRAGKLSLQQPLPVSERAWKMPGSRMFIDPKMQVPVEDLIKGMVVQSGNDATVALAEGVAASVEAFVQRMNEQARALGMKGTVYKNPEGLTEPGHLTTAGDLSILSRRLMTDFPEFMSYYALKKYRYPGTPAANDSNRNLLLFRDPSVDGLKTGHTQAAGYCLIATAKRDFPNLGAGGQPGPRRLMAIVLGAASENARANEAQKLLNWGFTVYEAVKLFDGNQPVVSPPVWKGRASVVKIGLPQPIVVAVPAGTASRLRTEVVRRDPLVAPFQLGQTMGSLRVRLDGQAILSEVPLVALEGVEEAGLIGRAWDSLRLWIK